MDRPPAEADARFDEGVRLLGEGDPDGALACFRRAAEAAPEFAEAHANIAYIVEQAGDSAAAESHYRRALALDPRLAQTWLNFGGFLTRQRRPDEAEEACRRAVFLDSAHPAAWSNFGVLLTGLRREREAEQCYRTALALDPDHAKSAFNLAYLLLRQGRYAEGWARFESRDWYQATAARLRCPRWNGEPLAGKSVLVGMEAGHGDMIQFCRYARELKARGARRVSVLCHPALKRLFRGLAGADDAIAVGDPAPAGVVWDYWSPPMSFPYFFDTRVDTVPAELPYLHVEPQQVADWAQALGDKGGALRVGLVWKGNPRFENDSERSLRSLAELAPLGDVAGVRFYSLQKGAGEAEAAASPFPIVDLAPRIADFSDTAAILANLDLLISVDTAVAHLAGALGRPCWLLLPDYKTDWRWLTERTDSPWYPGVMRLFRQGAAGGWTPVVAALRAALMAHPGRKPPG